MRGKHAVIVHRKVTVRTSWFVLSFNMLYQFPVRDGVILAFVTLKIILPRGCGLSVYWWIIAGFFVSSVDIWWSYCK